MEVDISIVRKEVKIQDGRDGGTITTLAHASFPKCEGRTYDSRCHLCCGNRLVYKRGRYLSCCKGHAYDYRSCVCRRGRVHCRRPDRNRPKPRPKPRPESDGPVTPV